MPDLAEVAVDAQGIVATLKLTLPDALLTSLAATTTAPLTPAELQAVGDRLQLFDNFITFIIKQAVHDTLTPQHREALLELLIDTRYQLLESLSTSDAMKTDPLRALFVATWLKLAPLLQQISAEQPTSTNAFSYISFISASNALQLLDAVGPQLGVEISVAGMRQLARLLTPHNPADPLEYDEMVDPKLRESLGFGPAMELDEPLQLPFNLLDLLITPAEAAAKLDPSLLKKLNQWVPQEDEINRYLTMVNTLLNYAAEERLNSMATKSDFQLLYRTVVFTTAWQESCWRQFTRKKGQRTPIVSGQGDVGIMQVNRHVWRGFYDIKKLSWDIAYNAKAGSEILLHYFNDYAVRKGEHTKTGNVDNLARATYSAYNGGPSALSRYRKKKAPKFAQHVDTSFYKKYQKVKRTNALTAVESCFAGGR